MTEIGEAWSCVAIQDRHSMRWNYRFLKLAIDDQRMAGRIVTAQRRVNGGFELVAKLSRRAVKMKSGKRVRL